MIKNYVNGSYSFVWVPVQTSFNPMALGNVISLHVNISLTSDDLLSKSSSLPLNISYALLCMYIIIDVPLV